MSTKEALNVDSLTAVGIHVSKVFKIADQYFYNGYVYDWAKFLDDEHRVSGIDEIASNLSFSFDNEVGYSQHLELYLSADDEQIFGNMKDQLIERLMNFLADYSHAD